MHSPESPLTLCRILSLERFVSQWGTTKIFALIVNSYEVKQKLANATADAENIAFPIE